MTTRTIKTDHGLELEIQFQNHGTDGWLIDTWCGWDPDTGDELRWMLDGTSLDDPDFNIIHGLEDSV